VAPGEVCGRDWREAWNHYCAISISSNDYYYHYCCHFASPKERESGNEGGEKLEELSRKSLCSFFWGRKANQSSSEQAELRVAAFGLRVVSCKSQFTIHNPKFATRKRSSQIATRQQLKQQQLQYGNTTSKLMANTFYSKEF